MQPLPEKITRKGVLTLRVQAEKPNEIKYSAKKQWWERDGKRLRFARFRRLIPTDTLVLVHPNAYVNTGLNNSLDREAGSGGAAVGYIGVSSNTTAVTATTVYLNGASGGTASNTIIKAATYSRTGQVGTYTVTSPFVNGDFTSGVFVWNKLGLLNTATDAGTGLIDVIGGTGGSSPYNRTFSLDLTSAGTFTVSPAIAVTAAA